MSATEIVSLEVKEVTEVSTVTTIVETDVATGENIEKIHTVKDSVVKVISSEKNSVGRPLTVSAPKSIDETLLKIFRSPTKSTTRVELGQVLYKKLTELGLIQVKTRVAIPGVKQSHPGRQTYELILSPSGKARASVLNMQAAAAAKRAAAKAEKEAAAELKKVGFVESTVPIDEDPTPQYSGKKVSETV